MKPAPAELAADTWRLMFDFFISSNPQRSESLTRRGLTPNDSRILNSLDTAGRPIGELARQFNSDPSNTTWVVDRLEQAGYVERRPSPTDRRVKLVALTPLGLETQTALLTEFRVPPPSLAALSSAELETLHRLFLKLSPPTTDR
ncbi:hypothetical protein VW23_008285 [Devosia insulae DS-56]|uniref:HTH marR-type domain-containing protein n=1 Tax=Devosia insulae DS-56 TaxID=1116389 RepID=A0A1E5XWY4_9HYPH|nr:MarR family transcriptional regulator [Devosia insulae]OEO33095.1 hypothetical protein VW23_008285 [Devosia insulae DS-56]